MITKFKIFENNDTPKFWVVENNKYFFVSLYKIGLSFPIISTYKHLKQRNDKYFFIGKDSYKYYWVKYNYSVGSNEFVRNGFVFQDFVNVNQDDINKYNYDYEIYLLKKNNDVKKYNL
jgi:hypothetical protein